MISDILNILKDYHDKKKYADTTFVMKICSIIINYYQINRYIDNIFIVDDINGPDSLYSFTYNVVIINLKKSYYKDYHYTLKDEYYGMYNLMVLRTILHELEHALQEKVKDTNKNTIERKLLILGDPTSYIKEPNNLLSKISFNIKRYKHAIYYNTHYYLAPYERFAIIKSCCGIKTISQNDFIHNSDYYNATDYFNNCELNHILSYGYYLVDEITTSPSLMYLYRLTKKNHDIIMNDKSFKDHQVPAEDRLLYGLSLTKNECQHIEDVKNNLVKKYGGRYE